MSASFAPLARTVAEGIGHAGLPMVVVPHPVAEREQAAVRAKGAAVADECARLLTADAETIEREMRERQWALPATVMPR